MPDPSQLTPGAVELPEAEVHEAVVNEDATAAGQKVRCVVPGFSEIHAFDPMSWSSVTTAAGEFWPKRGDRAQISSPPDGPAAILFWEPGEGAVPDVANLAVPATLLDAKGDLIGASAADTPARLGVGADGQVLTADASEGMGLRWATPRIPGVILCRLATAAALPANTRTANTRTANANGALGAIDEVTAVVNDYILDKSDGTGANRGVWKVTSVGSAGSKWSMERVPEMDSSAECTPGMLVTVSEGTVNRDSIWQLITDAPITLNATALVFAPVAPSYTIEGVASESPALTEASKVIGGTEIELLFPGYYKIEAYFDAESAGGFGLLGAIEVAGVIKGPEIHQTAAARISVSGGFKSAYLAAGTKIRLSAKRGPAATTVYSGHTRIIAERCL